MLLSSTLYELLSLIYRGKTSEMSQACSQVFLNLRHNSFQTKGRLVRMVDQNGGNFERFKTSKKYCIFFKSHFSFAEVHWVTSVGFESTTSGLDLPMLYRLSYEANTGAGRGNSDSESR